jgi:lipopolysaccharide transport system permease protein
MSSGLSAFGDRFELVVTPPRRWGRLSLREFWGYRELLYFLTKRELQIRYKQSIFGVSWAVLQPLALAFLFALFFGRLAKIPSEGVPYPVFALAGLAPWLFASMATTQSAASLIGDANLLTKVYFPRLVLPVAKLLSLLVDLAISLTVVIVFMVVYGVPFRWHIVLAPLFLVLAFVTALGLGVFLAALNVQYRDVSVAIPLAVQLWLFATPVVYPGSLITGAWQYIYALNPMVSVIQGIRWALLGTQTPVIGAVGVSVATALAGVIGGVIYFTRTERFFADIV